MVVIVSLYERLLHFHFLLVFAFLVATGSSQPFPKDQKLPSDPDVFQIAIKDQLSRFVVSGELESQHSSSLSNLGVLIDCLKDSRHLPLEPWIGSNLPLKVVTKNPIKSGDTIMSWRSDDGVQASKARSVINTQFGINIALSEVSPSVASLLSEEPTASDSTVTEELIFNSPFADSESSKLSIQLLYSLLLSEAVSPLVMRSEADQSDLLLWKLIQVRPAGLNTLLYSDQEMKPLGSGLIADLTHLKRLQMNNRPSSSACIDKLTGLLGLESPSSSSLRLKLLHLCWNAEILSWKTVFVDPESQEPIGFPFLFPFRQNTLVKGTKIEYSGNHEWRLIATKSFSPGEEIFLKASISNVFLQDPIDCLVFHLPKSVCISQQMSSSRTAIITSVQSLIYAGFLNLPNLEDEVVFFIESDVPNFLEPLWLESNLPLKDFLPIFIPLGKAPSQLIHINRILEASMKDVSNFGALILDGNSASLEHEMKSLQASIKILRLQWSKSSPSSFESHLQFLEGLFTRHLEENSESHGSSSLALSNIAAAVSIQTRELQIIMSSTKEILRFWAQILNEGMPLISNYTLPSLPDLELIIPPEKIGILQIESSPEIIDLPILRQTNISEWKSFSLSLLSVEWGDFLHRSVAQASLKGPPVTFLNLLDVLGSLDGDCIVQESSTGPPSFFPQTEFSQLQNCRIAAWSHRPLAAGSKKSFDVELKSRKAQTFHPRRQLQRLFPEAEGLFNKFWSETYRQQLIQSSLSLERSKHSTITIFSNVLELTVFPNGSLSVSLQQQLPKPKENLYVAFTRVPDFGDDSLLRKSQKSEQQQEEDQDRLKLLDDILDSKPASTVSFSHFDDVFVRFERPLNTQSTQTREVLESAVEKEVQEGLLIRKESLIPLAVFLFPSPSAQTICPTIQIEERMNLDLMLRLAPLISLLRANPTAPVLIPRVEWHPLVPVVLKKLLNLDNRVQLIETDGRAAAIYPTEHLVVSTDHHRHSSRPNLPSIMLLHSLHLTFQREKRLTISQPPIIVVIDNYKSSSGIQKKQSILNVGYVAESLQQAFPEKLVRVLPSFSEKISGQAYVDLLLDTLLNEHTEAVIAASASQELSWLATFLPNPKVFVAEMLYQGSLPSVSGPCSFNAGGFYYHLFSALDVAYGFLVAEDSYSGSPFSIDVEELVGLLRTHFSHTRE